MPYGTFYGSIIGRNASVAQIGRFDLVVGHLTSGSLYTFSSFTFTPAGATGQQGPTYAQTQSNYNTGANSWLTNTSYFNITTQGIQEWTVPASGTYRIQAAGASGGIHAGNYFPAFPGAGATVQADVVLTGGEKIYIVIGQKPTSIASEGANGSGGGGGTFIYRGASATAGIGGGGLILVAGGGGGSGHGSSGSTGGNGVGGSSTNDSNERSAGSTFGVNSRQGNGSVGNLGSGLGGRATTTSQAGGTSGGAGWGGDGQNTTLTSGNTGGLRFIGGTSEDGASQHGGFGGGGPGGGNGNAGGGGGGYTGGGAGGGWTSVYWGGGGGGGSYVISGATNITMTEGASGINYADTANGYATITKL
jgi:hypothetical protein